jgi:hypothetical protein
MSQISLVSAGCLATGASQSNFIGLVLVMRQKSAFFWFKFY